MSFHDPSEYPRPMSTPLRPGSAASNRSRRSSCSFDASNCPEGVLKAVLQSSLEAKQFYADLIDSEPTFLRELDLTLDWSTTYSDLKHMRDAVLKVPQILKLRLDCGNHNGPTTDIVNRGKRGNPLVQIMMQHRHLVLIDFVGSDGLFSKSSHSAFEDTSSLGGARRDGAMSVSVPSSRRGSLASEMSISTSTATGVSLVSSAFSTLTMGALGGSSAHETPTTHLREVHIDGNFDPKAHASKLKLLLDRSPKLFALTLNCKDLDFACTVYTIRELVSTYPMFRYLDLSSPQFSAVFDRLDPTSAFAKAPMREDLKPSLGLDNSLVVIERFGSDLETLLIDDSFSNEHIELLERVTNERRKLKLLDMRIGFAMISNSAITAAGQRSLEVILRRPPQPVPGFEQQQLSMSPTGSPLSSPRLSPSSQFPGGVPVEMQPPTELMFAISRDRLDWFPFLGKVLDRTSAIRVDFHSLNKWLPLLDQSILLPNPNALMQPLGGSTDAQLRRKSVAQQQLSSLMASSNPGAILTTDQINPHDPPPQTYPIRSIELRGTGGFLQAPAVRSLTRLLSLAPHLEILSMADFEIESTAEWEGVLGSIALQDLKQISLHETNVDGHQLALFMNRVPVGSTLKTMDLTKTDLKGQDVEDLRQAINERIPGCRLII
ncbi:hypothetical protein BGZ95_001531 [Linnemannia exigua]|uniref:RNI-like protein n=1 Tax=Linnemannia exigua TaxID=604196 RepID=A0AAD4DIW3_9FUNG|nr:hypothetical protein BGZ95_001531 [Linnemannia exigua]